MAVSYPDKQFLMSREMASPMDNYELLLHRGKDTTSKAPRPVEAAQNGEGT